MSIDDPRPEDRPWRERYGNDGPMLSARPVHPTQEQSALSDASFLAGWRAASGPLLADRAELQAEVERLREDCATLAEARVDDMLRLDAAVARADAAEATITSLAKMVDAMSPELAKQRARADAAEAREAALRETLVDFADHGLRADLNPTVDGSSTGAAIVALCGYLARVDTSVRDRARDVLAAAVPSVPTEQPEWAKHAHWCPQGVPAGANDRCTCKQSAPAPSGDAVEPETTEPTMMRWHTVADTSRERLVSAGRAASIVAWVNANGGEARYEPAEGCSEQDTRAARIVITGPNGDVVMRPGNTAVMGEWFVTNPGAPRAQIDRLREFTVSTPTGEQR